jgi:predicted lipoprotein
VDAGASGEPDTSDEKPSAPARTNDASVDESAPNALASSDGGASTRPERTSELSLPPTADVASAPAVSPGAVGAMPDASASGQGGLTGDPRDVAAALEDGALEDDCGSPPVSDASFTRRGLREAAAQCAAWHYCRFDSVAETLELRVNEYAAGPSAATLERARAAWRDAMVDWSTVELFQFGPLGSRSASAGKDMYEGQGIRDLIYAWPSISRCRVEEQLVTRNYSTRGLEGALISGRGLYGLEYLLFYEGSDTACTSAAQPDWNELSNAQIATRKREYAAAISSDVVAQIRRLSDLWSPNGGDFATKLVNAEGEYPDEQEVLKVMAWSLVYVEREVKDWKVGIPAGYTLSHPVTSPETPHAQIGTETIRVNLQGFRRLFQGCGADGEGIGFDDWLTEVGHSELASEMIAALTVAERVVDESPPLHEATLEELDALY